MAFLAIYVALHSLILACVAVPTRVLFIGNSFTFVNDLPQQLVHVAASLGQEVEVNKSVKGGCTLLALSSMDTTQQLLQANWDYIVLQDYSILPTVQEARLQYLMPAVKEISARKKSAKLILYLTWGYHDGLEAACPSSDTRSCFPRGTLAELTKPSCNSSDHYKKSVASFECMGYALARGYFSVKERLGIDFVAPCGLAWQAVRGSQRIPSDCKALVDSEYSGDLGLPLPFQVEGAVLPNRSLNIVDPTAYDKHPSRAGQYLNALVFYATIFGQSPIGAAPPLQTSEWGKPEAQLIPAELLSLQKAAEGAVMQCGTTCGTKERESPSFFT